MPDCAPARVSVVIPTRDRTELLRGAIASVLALTGPDLQLEVIVVDNGATGAVEPVVCELGAVYVRSAPGASAARNAGMRAATGEFIAFLDDDDRWLPGHVRPHLRLLRERPELAGVVGQATSASYDLDSAGPPWPVGLPEDGDLFAAFLGYCPQVGATVVRTGVRDTVGFFNEALVGDEDWDWHLRLALRHPLGFVPEPSVLFRQRPAGADTDLDWLRLPYGRRVFVRNVRRAGARRPSWPVVARQYLAMNALFHYRLVAGADAHLAAGDRAGARRALCRAAAASPLHALRDLTLRRDTRSLALRAFARR